MDDAGCQVEKRWRHRGAKCSSGSNKNADHLWVSSLPLVFSSISHVIAKRLAVDTDATHKHHTLRNAKAQTTQRNGPNPSELRKRTNIKCGSSRGCTAHGTSAGSSRRPSAPRMMRPPRRTWP
eukprot:scaffold6742_cov305-Pinguiococcus_pyrenoidosus.AAC.2